MQPAKTALLHLIIPAYGDSPYLKQAIESAIQNLDSSIPITVIDDASPTNSVNECVSEFYPRVEYVRNNFNIGLASNFKKSFDISRGQYTVVMGSDDLVLPGFQSTIKSVVTNYPTASVIQPGVQVVDENNKVISPLVDSIKMRIRGPLQKASTIKNQVLLKKLATGNFMYFPSIAWRTELMRNINWREDLKHAVDLDLLFKIASQNGMFVFSPESVFAYRRHSNSISSVLANESTRLREEFDVHYQLSKNLSWRGNAFIKLSANLAVTVRLHGLIIGIKKCASSPSGGLCHIRLALSPLKPL